MKKNNKKYLIKFLRYVNNILHHENKIKINKLKIELKKTENVLNNVSKELKETTKVLKTSREILSALVYVWDNDTNFNCNCKKYNIYRTNKFFDQVVNLNKQK